MIICCRYSLPLFPSLIELVSPDHGHDQVNLHHTLLLRSQILVGLKLLLDSLTELVPVEVAYEFFERLLVDLISLLEGIHIKFDQILMFKGLR